LAPPRWGQVREFCLKQGYRETRTDHFHYLKVLTDGSTSGTMVSMSKDGDEVPAQMWSRVWRRQLRLAGEEEFWKGLRGDSVQYAVSPVEEQAEPLPPYLVRFLRDVLHRSDEEIAATTREKAQNELNAYYARELRKQI
jgi:hypothetical protein